MLCAAVFLLLKSAIISGKALFSVLFIQMCWVYVIKMSYSTSTGTVNYAEGEYHQNSR